MRRLLASAFVCAAGLLAAAPALAEDPVVYEVKAGILAHDVGGL